MAMLMDKITIATVPWFGTKSHSRRDITLTVFGTADKLTLPVEVTTKVTEVRWMLSQRLGVEPETLAFVVKQASSFKKLNESDEIRSCTVRGIKSWTRTKAKYPHPICIIGAGHQGLRQALSFIKEGFTQFTVYDRWHKPGGTAWVSNANPTSKLQTELGAYHLQYDKDFPIPRQTMKTWPTRDELLEHFAQVCDEYGITAHVRYTTAVTNLQIIKDGGGNDVDPRTQHIIAKSCPASEEDTIEEDAKVEETFSAVACYPGALVAPLRVDYKGEEDYDGTIGYGMFEEFNYEKVRDEIPAIMGMGAFAVENVRTCLEHGASKVWLICRRKNIAMPRVVSWFINQSMNPPTGAMCLEMMKPMYNLIPDDPWSFYAVVANKEKTMATLRQKARFGIGDVYFLAHYYKKVELVIDSIKRLQGRTIIMDSGDRIHADHLVKVLGFRADEKIDNLLKIKEMVGFFVNGDWRRWCFTESPGVDAGRFGGTSLSPGLIGTVEAFSWFLNYPKDALLMLNSMALPKNKPNKDKGLPAYVWENRMSSMVSMVLGGGIVPGLAELSAAYGPLNRAKMLEAHPLEEFIDEAAAEWDSYCKMLQAPDDTRPHPPYPYTHEYVRDYVERNDNEGAIN